MVSSSEYGSDHLGFHKMYKLSGVDENIVSDEVHFSTDLISEIEH